MQFAKTFLAIAAIASSAFAIDYTSPDVVACSKENWAAIKAKSDPMLGIAKSVLSDAQYKKLQELTGQETPTSFPAEVDEAFLTQLPEAIPAMYLDLAAKDIIQKCLDNGGAAGGESSAAESSAEEPSADDSSAEAPTDEAPTDEAPTDEAPTDESSAEEASSSEDAPAPESSAPAKCIPRPAY
ncbi:hypothetical protein GGF43_000775 [Coemansia sp. RSA 2618]|nr:hypothetical protein GGF43_000775 [Coemansia sp. RSA 2618]